MGAFAAAAVALVLIVASVGCQSGEEATATDQTPAAAEAPENTVNARAVEVATGFLKAYGAFDVEQARTYLADDATIASMGAQDDLRLLISYLKATGYEQILGSCEGLGNSSSGSIRCPFDFHALRSGEIGRGPFGGSSFNLDVRDGKIVRATQDWEIEEFSPQISIDGMVSRCAFETIEGVSRSGVRSRNTLAISSSSGRCGRLIESAMNFSV